MVRSSSIRSTSSKASSAFQHLRIPLPITAYRIGNNGFGIHMDLERLPHFIGEQLPRLSNLLRVMAEQVHDDFVSRGQEQGASSGTQHSVILEHEAKVSEDGHGTDETDTWSTTDSSSSRDIEQARRVHSIVRSNHSGEVVDNTLSALEVSTQLLDEDSAQVDVEHALMARCWEMYDEVVEAEYSFEPLPSLDFPFEKIHTGTGFKKKRYGRLDRLMRKCMNRLKQGRLKFTSLSQNLDN